jgi:glycosyltransferase 2 family protein
MARSSVRIVVSLALTALLLAFFLWRVDLTEVAETVASADPRWLLLSLTLALVTYYLRVLRWLLILRPVGGIRHSSAVLATASGYAAMALLPARMGDLVRPLLLAQRDRRPASALLASILTERILDFGTVILFFLVFVRWPPPMTQITAQGRTDLRILGWTGAALGAGLVAGVALVLALLRYQERLVRVLTAPLARFGPRWQGGAANFLHHFLDGLRALQRPRDLALIVAASILLWYVIYWQVQLNLIAFSIHLPLRAAFLLVTLAVIGLAIPTPAGAGGFHKATQIGLTQFFGVELGRATGYAIVYHAICFLPITVIGLLCLPAFGVSLRQVDRLSAQAKGGAETSVAPDPGENV